MAIILLRMKNIDYFFCLQLALMMFRLVLGRLHQTRTFLVQVGEIESCFWQVVFQLFEGTESFL